MFAFHALAQSAPLAEGQTTLIQGKSVQVTRADFDQELKNVPTDARLDFLASSPRVKRMLELIFLNKAAADSARTEGFDKDPEVLAELKYAMETKLASLYLAKMKASIKVPDMEARARETFRLRANDYATPELVHVSHILISTKTRSKPEALKRAEEVRQKALAGEDFEKLVQQYSEDPGSALTKGDLGFFSAEKMVPEFSKAAFALTKPGQISDPVESAFGFHIIRFVERRAPRPAVYAEHRKELIELAEETYRDNELRERINKLIAAQSPKPDEQAVTALTVKLDINKLPHENADGSISQPTKK